MQLLHQKQTSQSKALKNLVASLPVKEGQKLPVSEPIFRGSDHPEKNGIQKMRLDLEISTYWLLSKYTQSRRKMI